MRAYRCFMFEKTVVITGNCAGTYIGIVTNIAIAEICKMVGFAVFAKGCIFQFYKITNMRSFFANCAGAQAGIGTNDSVFPDNTTLQMGKGPDMCSFFYSDTRTDENMGFNKDIRSNKGISA